MNYDESTLVLISIVFGVALFIVVQIKAPKVRLLGKNTTYVDKTRLPSLLKLLVVVALCSLPVGLVVTRKSLLIAEFIGLNLLFAVIMGSNLVLLRKRPDR